MTLAQEEILQSRPASTGLAVGECSPIIEKYVVCEGGTPNEG